MTLEPDRGLTMGNRIGQDAQHAVDWPLVHTRYIGPDGASLIARCWLSADDEVIGDPVPGSREAWQVMPWDMSNGTERLIDGASARKVVVLAHSAQPEEVWNTSGGV